MLNSSPAHSNESPHEVAVLALRCLELVLVMLHVQANALMMITLLLTANPSASGSVAVALDMLQRMTDERGTTEDSCASVGTSNTWDNITQTCWKDASWQAVAVAGIAAALDFNNRDGTFAPQLDDLAGACVLAGFATLLACVARDPLRHTLRPGDT